MNKKAISIILGMVLVAASGGALWGNGNEVKALDSEKAGTSVMSTTTVENNGTETKTDIDTSVEKSSNNGELTDKDRTSREKSGEKDNVDQESTSQMSDVTTQQVTSFSDVKDTHWAKKSITAAIEKGYVSGYPGGVFKPEQAIKRDEFMKMVVTAMKLPVETEGASTWYEPFVKVAKENKLYVNSDFSDSDLGWNKVITRKEMARIAVRAGLGEEAKEDSKWMYLATKAGLVTGLGKGELGETKTTTRAQSVTIIERILAVKNGEKLPVDKYAVGSAELAWHGTNIFTVMPEIMVTKEEDYKGKTIEELWRQDQMTVETKDGKYKGVLEGLIAIDLEDPHDPNLKLLPPLNELKWDSNSGTIADVPTQVNYVSKWENSYILYFKGKEIFNKDDKSYRNDPRGPRKLLFGISTPDMKSFFEGNLNKQAIVYHKRLNDLSALILPKSGWKQDGKLVLKLYSPNLSESGYHANILFEIDGPNL
ncbi:S-layer homology domain-containing protein [Paenibacillus turicensis]|uniref:S-layer homology domain-containing protein n=1 Tax=Paenibacillus turicensis TaxID=160487 RepID=UPI003D2C82FD